MSCIIISGIEGTMLPRKELNIKPIPEEEVKKIFKDNSLFLSDGIRSDIPIMQSLSRLYSFDLSLAPKVGRVKIDSGNQYLLVDFQPPEGYIEPWYLSDQELEQSEISFFRLEIVD